MLTVHLSSIMRVWVCHAMQQQYFHVEGGSSDKKYYLMPEKLGRAVACAVKCGTSVTANAPL